MGLYVVALNGRSRSCRPATTAGAVRCRYARKIAGGDAAFSTAQRTGFARGWYVGRFSKVSFGHPCRAVSAPPEKRRR
jgi:hypothetical protein